MRRRGGHVAPVCRAAGRALVRSSAQREHTPAAATATLPLTPDPHAPAASTYTKGFRRPYDTRINAAMVATATDLLERFGAVTAYTESDEISLVWPPAAPQGVQVLPFNGRVQKVVSVTAGYASARFNKHMLAQTFDPQTEAGLIARVEASEAHFDARLFSLPSAERVHAYMRWRRRTAVATRSACSRRRIPAAQLHGVDARAMVRLLREEKVEWSAQPAFFRYGSYVKKEEFTKQAFNPKRAAGPRAARARSSAPSSRRTMPRPAASCSAASGHPRAKRAGLVSLSTLSASRGPP